MLKTAVANRITIIRIINALSWATTLFAAYGSVAILADLPGSLFFLKSGRLVGQVSLVLFVIVILPSILRRFGVRWEPATVVMLFRRQLGVLMFVFALAHYLFVGLVPNILYGKLPESIPVYQVLGMLAFMATLPLAVTSNDYFQRRMGKNWTRLHRLVYIIVWLIFGHVVLFSGVGFWSILIFIIAALELLSLAYAASRKATFQKAPKTELSM
ncbi:MAG: ferric reductase-like transmembrane domain-containing protein [Patescibacteria group bacterium]|nr:ferric reductase-like transmembrane domain-containing protein [Patescibacteria group bacterium]